MLYLWRWHLSKRCPYCRLCWRHWMFTVVALFPQRFSVVFPDAPIHPPSHTHTHIYICIHLHTTPFANWSHLRKLPLHHVRYADDALCSKFQLKDLTTSTEQHAETWRIRIPCNWPLTSLYAPLFTTLSPCSLVTSTSISVKNIIALIDSVTTKRYCSYCLHLFIVFVEFFENSTMIDFSSFF